VAVCVDSGREGVNSGLNLAVKIQGRRIEIRPGTVQTSAVRELRAATTRELRVVAVAVSRRAAPTVGAPGCRSVQGFCLGAGSSQRPSTG
jgi:hypothetical protein